MIGGLGAGGTDTDVVLVAKDTLKLNLRLIRGYKGSPDLSIAMERGEIDGRAIGWAPLQVGAYRTYIKEGRLRFLLQFGRATRWSKMPDGADRARACGEPARPGSDRDGRAAVPGDLSLRYASERAEGPPRNHAGGVHEDLQDPEYLEEANKLDLDVSPLDGATVRGMIERLAQSPPELIARYKAILEAK